MYIFTTDMSDTKKHVEITPAGLVINVVLDKDIGTELALKNITNKPIAFKVKTTAPERYQVRPIQGIIPPNATETCFIVMKAMSAYPDFDNPKDVKHKFLVQTVEVPAEGVTDLQAFWKETEAKQKAGNGAVFYLDQRITCKLRPQPEAAINEKPQQVGAVEDYRGLFAFSTEQTARIQQLTAIKEQLTEELKSVNQTKSQLETRISALQKENTDLLKSSKKSGGSKIWLVAFTALFAANVAVIAYNYYN